MSSFSWLDYAEADRQAALDVIDLFREQETRDELGIGTVRDAFSDLLFPGTSSVQTRAKYFFIVPWTYLRHERSRTESAEIAQKMRRDEIALIDVLQGSDDPDGIIGIRAKKTLKRLPSMIYWQGLGRLGIRTYTGGRDQYHRSLDRFYARLNGTVRNDDGEVVDGVRPRNWDPGLPESPPGFPKTCSLALSRSEARYLRERIVHAAPKSLFAYLVDTSESVSEVGFPWEHPEVSSFPNHLISVLEHSRNFSEALHGATLLYNLILAELDKNEETTSDYLESVREWGELIADDAARFRDWNVESFWSTVLTVNPRIPPLTRRFIDAWLGLARGGQMKSIAQSTSARVLIANRERELKRGLARVDGGRALELWGGAVGTRQIDYRWGAIARRMVEDIHSGLRRTDA